MRVVLAHGPAGLFDFFPLLLIGAAICLLVNVMRDGQRRATSKTPRLPTSSWSRQVATATRKRRGTAPPVAPSPERPGPPRRVGPPHLRVMNGEGQDSRPAVPRRFEPPPPGRRKTG